MSARSSESVMTPSVSNKPYPIECSKNRTKDATVIVPGFVEWRFAHACAKDRSAEKHRLEFGNFPPFHPPERPKGAGRAYAQSQPSAGLRDHAPGRHARSAPTSL